MSNIQVPEVPSAEAQLDALRNKLAGNAAFGRVRGLLGKATIDLMLACGNGKSRASARRDWAELSAAMAVMQSLLAQYDRDQWSAAKAELMWALRTEGYIMTGETIPLEETEPYTIFMVDPVLTFGMLGLFRDWVRDDAIPACEHTPFWRRLRDDEAIQRSYGEAVRSIVSQCSRDGDEEVPFYWELIAAFGRRLQIPTQSFGGRTTDLIPCHISNINGTSEFADLTSVRRPISNRACAFGKPCEQSQLLAAFSRKDQHRIASWQFHLPRAMEFGGESARYVVIFYPEHEHPRWQKERPQFTSRGVAHGYGAMVVWNGRRYPSIDSEHFDTHIRLDNRRYNGS